MPEDDLRVSDRPSAEDLAFLERQIDEYNVDATGYRDGRLLAIFVRDAQGEVRAGLAGHTWGGCCEVRFLWVRESERRTGLGSRLLAAAEREAEARGCRQIVLSTHSFQAPEFYRRRGYSVVGERSGHPRGHSQLFLGKRLAPEVPGYTIVRAAPGHLAQLPAIEEAATAQFPPEDLPQALRAHVTPRRDLATAQSSGRLWVALSSTGEPVGFALVGLVDGNAHLTELDVHPRHGRKGLGSLLLQRVLAWARTEGLPALTLTTFSHLPWNAPFYAREGFRALAPAERGAGLERILRAERARGLRRRVAMRLDLARD